MAAPVLEDVRQSRDPAWLWDPVRLRIVWANRAGIAYFGGETIFDLIDRPFDLAEPGVALIAGNARRLKHGEALSLDLDFPSAGRGGPLACVVTPHVLADGRLGLLAVASEAMPGPEANEASRAAAFDALPAAAIIAGEDGRILHCNRAALGLLPRPQPQSLGDLLGSGASLTLMQRLKASGTLSSLQRVEGRDLRFTLKRSAEPPHDTVAIVEDITERRALERELEGRPETETDTPPPLSPALNEDERRAFETLGHVLNGAPEPAPPPRLPVPQVPGFIRESLDRAPGAALYVHNGAVFHANPAAVALLKYPNAEALIATTSISTALSGAAGRSVSLACGDGSQLTVSLSESSMPWVSGPARRITLMPAPRPPADLFPALVEEETAVTAAPEQRPPPLPEPLPPPTPAAPRDTAFLEADSELRAILDTAADGIVTLDRDGLVKSFSAAAESIFGRSQADVAGKVFSSLFAPESRKSVRDYLSALQGPGLASVFNDGREVTALEKNGGEVPLFLTISELRKQQSSGSAFCAVVRDITQWKKTEQDLREARDAAERASRQKSEFLAKISHELRTPLNAIMGFSEVMRLEQFGEIANLKYRGYVNDIHDSGKHLLELIDDLLDLSRVEAGKLELNFTSVSLSEVIDYGLRMVQEQAAAQRVILRKSVAAEVPNVVADLRSMRQIVLNLLSNAVKFTDEGGQAIISAVLTEAGEVKLKVKDSGIGMSPEQIRDALEPYRRVTTDGRDSQGTGLGLPLTKALAEANRTAFAISSEPKKGTLVEVTFPAMRVLAS